jgi:probable F420-dependent oxidoreductase
MEIDLMTGGKTWSDAAHLATEMQGAGFSGLLWTETSSVPWMQIAAAATAAPELYFTTGIAVAFPRSPMVSAAIAWEMAENTNGRFRLGLGSQVKAHIERRYSAEFSKPAARMREYLQAVKACFRAFAGEERLQYEGEFYNMSLLPRDWAPGRHDHEMKLDVSAVGPLMTKVAGEVADGIHVHPLHSMHYIETRLLPNVASGAETGGRSPADVDLIVPVFACPGDTPEERQPYVDRARRQIGFYGSTRNYAFQFDDLGFDGVSAQLNTALKAGDLAAMADIITDDMLEHFALIASWDDMADRLIERYSDTAARVVMYLGEAQMMSDPDHLAKWSEIAQAVRAA